MSDQIVVGLVPPHQDATAIEAAITRITSSTELPMHAVLMHPPLSAAATQPSFQSNGWQFVVGAKLAQDQSALAQSLGQSFRSALHPTVC